jgi:hypothetical protein
MRTSGWKETFSSNDSAIDMIKMKYAPYLSNQLRAAISNHSHLQLNQLIQPLSANDTKSDYPTLQ